MQRFVALVVDDEAAMHTLYEMILAPVGFAVQQAADGEQALALLRHQLPDVVFLDILLPKRDGRAILDYRDATPRLRHVPVVVVSAHSHFQRLLALRPEDSFLVKPVRPNQIRDAALAAVGYRM
ncbi:MAG: response regulator [Aggregatilineales bacterium]